MAFGYYCTNEEEACHLRKLSDAFYEQGAADDVEQEEWFRWLEIIEVLDNWRDGRSTPMPSTTKGVSHA